MELIEALEVLTAIHLRAMEFEDWRVEMLPSLEWAPWDRERYIPAWEVVRRYVLEKHAR